MEGRGGMVVRGTAARAFSGLVGLVVLTGPAAAQSSGSTDPPASPATAATRTHARSGLGWGAAAGGGLGGLALGVLARGLCEGGDCEGSFGKGFLVGMAGGAVAGGIAGMVLGAAFPADGPVADGRSWTARAGIRHAWSGGLEGTGASVGGSTLRATTARTSFGVELGYLGRAREAGPEVLAPGGRPGGSGETVRLRQEWRVGRLALVATHVPGSTGSARPFLLASFGLYPTLETLVELRGEAADPARRVVGRTFVPAPGLGVGAGVRLPTGGRYGLELRSRLEVVAGIGENDVAPFFQVDLGLVRGPVPSVRSP